MNQSRAILVAVALAVNPFHAPAQPYFETVPIDPNAAFPRSGVGALSGNGEVAAAWQFDSAGGITWSLWTRDQGLVGLPPAALPIEVRALSYDGSTLVGELVGQFAGSIAFVYSANTGYVDVDPRNGNRSSARGISWDGSVVAISVDSRNEPAYRWTANDGFTPFGPLPGQWWTWARAISGDGSTIVGGGYLLGDPPDWQGFKWTEATGITPLGDLPGGSQRTVATAVSYDGNVIVGYGSSDLASGEYEDEAFRLVQGGPLEPLGDLPGGQFTSRAWAVSADGSIVVGTGRTERGTEVFVWDASSGMRRLQDVLAQHGLDVANWRLTSVAGISADGSTFAGEGRNPQGILQGWIAHIEPPCRADFNNDDTLNSQDFFDFLLCFFDALACPPLAADFNADGAVTTQDFFDFLDAFFAGCP